MSGMVIFGRGVNDRYGTKWMPTGNKEYRCNTVVYWIVGDYVCNVLAFCHFIEQLTLACRSVLLNAVRSV